MLAVLPFQNMSSDNNEDYFADGLTEEMIAQLGELQPSSLGVIARTSAMRYKNSKESIAQIGRELGVDAVVEAQRLVALNYFEDGSVQGACPPLKALQDNREIQEAFPGQLKKIAPL